MGRFKSRLLLISSYLFLFSGWISPFSITSEIHKLHALQPFFDQWNSLINRSLNMIGITASPAIQTIISTTVLMIISQNLASLYYTGHLLHTLIPVASDLIEFNKKMYNHLKTSLQTLYKLFQSLKIFFIFRPAVRRRSPLQLLWIIFCSFVALLFLALYVSFYVSVLIIFVPFFYFLLLMVYPVFVILSAMTYMYMPFFVILLTYSFINIISNPIGHRVAEWLQNMALL
jgi:hypothetical protein